MDEKQIDLNSCACTFNKRKKIRILRELFIFTLFIFISVIKIILRIISSKFTLDFN